MNFCVQTVYPYIKGGYSLHGGCIEDQTPDLSWPCANFYSFIIMVFCCIFQALRKLWKDAGGEAPDESLTMCELVLDSRDQLIQLNRLPGENEVRIVIRTMLLVHEQWM